MWLVFAELCAKYTFLAINTHHVYSSTRQVKHQIEWHNLTRMQLINIKWYALPRNATQSCINHNLSRPLHSPENKKNSVCLMLPYLDNSFWSGMVIWLWQPWTKKGITYLSFYLVTHILDLVAYRLVTRRCSVWTTYWPTQSCDKEIAYNLPTRLIPGTWV